MEKVMGSHGISKGQKSTNPEKYIIGKEKNIAVGKE